MDNHRFILLTGHRKSGTTMFQSLFDGHENVCCYPVDLTVLYAYFPHFVKNDESEEVMRDRLDQVVIGPLKDKLELHGINFDLEKFRSIFKAKIDKIDLRNMKEVILAMTSSWSELNNYDLSKPMVLKETSVDIYASKLFEWFPEMQIVQLVRDPRDNYAALKAGVSKYYSKMGESELSTLASLLNRAFIDMQMAISNVEIYGTNRYQVIRFEDVVCNTLETITSVANFLNIAFQDSLLVPTFMGEGSVGNNFDGNTMTKKVSSQNVSRWKKRITPEEAQIIEFVFRGLMEKFDYIPEFSEAEAAKAFSEYYQWSNYHYFFHDPFAATTD